VYRTRHDGPFRLQPEEVVRGEFLPIALVAKRAAGEPFCPDGLPVLDEYRRHLGADPSQPPAGGNVAGHMVTRLDCRNTERARMPVNREGAICMSRAGVAALLALSALASGLSGCSEKPPVASIPPPEVSISQPIERSVSESLEFTGRIEAVESVEVRARVSGYITKVAFDAGALVKEGDLLFEIDPREYESAVDKAQGDIARLRANLTRASAEVTRTQRLKGSGAVSEREVDTATG